MEEEKKKNYFLFVFSTYLLVCLLKFRLGDLVGCGIKFYIQWVPTRHTFDGPRYPKNKKYLKNVMMMSSSHFFRYLFFCGSGAHQKYAEWVIIGCKILIPHQMISPDQNLSKNIGRYVKNTNEKVVFSFLPPKLINIIL